MNAIAPVATAGAPAELSIGRAGKQSRARYPDHEGYVERDGVRVFYEVYGEGEPTVLLLPTWSIVHSRFWKAQIAYLARHCRVIAFDGRGNGRSDRPAGAAAYHPDEFVLDALAVMDATATEHASHWREEYPAFVEWFVSRAFQEPHSTKAIEDGVGWALETEPETLIATYLDRESAGRTLGRPALRALAQDLSCSVLVVSGTHDKIVPPRDARALAHLSDGRLEVVPGSGHFPHARKPVQFNLALRDFSEDAFGRKRTPRDPTVYRPDGRPRALFVSSPIGLGHAQRDVAIARELRSLNPDLQIDWLAQDPVTRVLSAEGERIHPASAHLANESRHIESESAEHDLHCFHALRRMDEILAANFMLFHDVVREDRYDLWIGDEAWELDYYLHENPREKRVPFAWLTDFVGFLPMDDDDRRERFVTADYNADMVDHIAEHPEVRDLALFVGNPDDIVAERLGPQLPTIRDWTERHFDFTGYVTGARSCVRSSATATTSVSASSPSVGPASEPACCDA
jgi:pimeloyl-ACP methyl ester carboxylesterase